MGVGGRSTQWEEWEGRPAVWVLAVPSSRPAVEHLETCGFWLRAHSGMHVQLRRAELRMWMPFLAAGSCVQRSSPCKGHAAQATCVFTRPCGAGNVRLHAALQRLALWHATGRLWSASPGSGEGGPPLCCCKAAAFCPAASTAFTLLPLLCMPPFSAVVCVQHCFRPFSLLAATKLWP